MSKYCINACCLVLTGIPLRRESQFFSGFDAQKKVLKFEDLKLVPRS